MMEELRRETAELREDVKSIRRAIDHLVTAVDESRTLLIGDGRELSLSAKVHILWNSTLFLLVSVVGLLVERAYHLLVRES